MRIGRNTDLPLLELGGWEPHLPDAHPAELGSLVRSANDALQFLSGLADLDEARRAHAAIEPLLKGAFDRLAAAIEALEARGTDAFSERVVVDLNELVERVKLELSGEWQGPTYAYQLLRGHLGDDTDEAAMQSAGTWRPSSGSSTPKPSVASSAGRGHQPRDDTRVVVGGGSRSASDGTANGDRRYSPN